MGTLSLRDQLRHALREKGWTVARLLDESGLECDRSSLDRKINGRQILRAEECQAIAAALNTQLVWSASKPRRTHVQRRHGKRVKR